MLNLPQRTRKPRTNGLTAITDLGIPLRELEAILQSYGEYLDIAKFGIGSAYACPILKDKIRLYKEHGVVPYFGGTLYEKFYYQDKVEEYLHFMQDYEIDMVEVSTGVLESPMEEVLESVAFYRDKGFMVVVEVGCKDQDVIMPPSEWIKQTDAYLAAGCRWVITEGRNSGTAGIYRTSGEIRTGLVHDLIAAVGAENLIFEAPTGGSQAYFINTVGANVNLGNVDPRELLQLESQRLGLKYETFYVE